MMVSERRLYQSSVVVLFILAAFRISRNAINYQPAHLVVDKKNQLCTKSIMNNETSHENRTYVCFATVQMAANGDFMEPIQNMTAIGIRLPSPFRYIVITNDDGLNTQDWEKVVLTLNTTKYTRVKTHVSYGKFLAWRLPAFQSCRIIFQMDSLNVPINNASVWQELEHRINQSPGKLLAQIKSGDKGDKTILDLVKQLPQMKKDTKQNAERTSDWLLSRPSFDNSTLCLWTNFFGYDPTSPLYRQASDEFWEYYSTEMTTARDQPIWSWMVKKWAVKPSILFTSPPKLLDKRPHVHVCQEKYQMFCQEADDPEDYYCRKAKTNHRYQHRLIDMQNASAIDCDKKSGGHTMSVLNMFK